MVQFDQVVLQVLLFLACLEGLGYLVDQLDLVNQVDLGFLLDQIVPSVHLFQAFLVDLGDLEALELHSRPSSLVLLGHLLEDPEALEVLIVP